MNLAKIHELKRDLSVHSLGEWDVFVDDEGLVIFRYWSDSDGAPTAERAMLDWILTFFSYDELFWRLLNLVPEGERIERPQM